MLVRLIGINGLTLYRLLAELLPVLVWVVKLWVDKRSKLLRLVRIVGWVVVMGCGHSLNNSFLRVQLILLNLSSILLLIDDEANAHAKPNTEKDPQQNRPA